MNPIFTETFLRSFHRIAVLILLFGLALIAVDLARATLVEPVTLPELVKRSPTIVHGFVLETRTQSEAGGAQIYTYVTVSGREFLKGGPAAGKSVTFRQIGGQVGDQVIYVPGAPRFRPKQEVLVFLTGEDGGGYPQVMGIFQGAFHPAPGPGGERRVEGLTPDAVTSLLPEKTQGVGGPEVHGPPVGGSFTDFLQRIRDLVKKQAGGGKR